MQISIGPLAINWTTKAERVMNAAGTAAIRAAARQAASGASVAVDPVAAVGQRPSPGPLPPASGDDSPGPLRYQVPYQVNQIWTPRADRTPFRVLRDLADISPEIRMCVQARKDQIAGLPWDIVPRERGTVRPDQAQQEAQRQRIRDLKAAFVKPDRRQTFRTWLTSAMEDVLVIDALSIYRRKRRNGKHFALELIDGATIKVLVDDNGRTPLPPAPAYRQILYGHPVEGGDMTIDQLYYRPMSPRTHTVYGMSPTEAVLVIVNSALNRQIFNLRYYLAGTMPEAFIDAPAGWSTKQIAEFQEYFDALLAGNADKRSGNVRFLAEGMAASFKQVREPSFTPDWDEWLLRVIAAVFAMPVTELGFTEKSNRSNGQEQEAVLYRRAIKPTAAFFKDLFDEVLADDLQAPDFEFSFLGGEADDRLANAKADQIDWEMGVASTDDLRLQRGREPIGLGPTLYIQGQGVQLVDQILAQDPNPDTGANIEGDGTTTGGGEDRIEQPIYVAAMRSDLRKWRTVAMNAVRRGETVKAFTSDHIPAPLQAIIREDLAEARDLDTVVSTFEKARRLTEDQVQLQSKMERLFSRFYRHQGDALASHIRDGMGGQG